jgi:hypothetical protein
MASPCGKACWAPLSLDGAISAIRLIDSRSGQCPGIPTTPESSRLSVLDLTWREFTTKIGDTDLENPAEEGNRGIDNPVGHFLLQD